MDFVPSRFDLHLGANSTPAGLEMICTYNTDLFRPSTITTLLATLGELARIVGEAPDSTIAALCAQLTAFEREQTIERQRHRAQKQAQGLRAIRRGGSSRN